MISIAQHFVSLIVAILVGLFAARWGGPFFSALPFTLGAITYCVIRYKWRPVYVRVSALSFKEAPWEEAKISHPGYASMQPFLIGLFAIVLLGIDLVTFLSRFA